MLGWIATILSGEARYWSWRPLYQGTLCVGTIVAHPDFAFRWFQRAGCVRYGPDVATSMQATSEFLDDLLEVFDVLLDDPAGLL